MDSGLGWKITQHNGTVGPRSEGKVRGFFIHLPSTDSDNVLERNGLATIFMGHSMDPHENKSLVILYM